jgi:DNA modification methylase
MQIESVALNKIIPYIRNPRKNENAVDKVASSIQEFGFRQPIVVDAENVIIAGHTRFEAAKRLGLDLVPVHVADGLTEQQVKAYRIADNRVGQEAEWDYDLLKLEMEELDNPAMTGFDEDELNGILAEVGEGLTDPDEVPEVPEVPITVTGDLWELGEHRLVCGDSTNADDVEKALGNVKPMLMVTDPPYGVEYDADWRNHASRADGTNIGGSAIGKVENDDKADWSEAWALFPGDVAYVWHAGNKAHIVAESLLSCDFEIRAQIIWAKNQFVIGRGHYHPHHEPCWYAVKNVGHWNGDRKQSTIWNIDKNRKSETGHSTQKPVECMKRPIENNSSIGQAVYDPFLGSGTTMIASEMTGRQCIGLELSAQYCDVIITRWSEFTGKDDLLLNGKPFKWSERKIKKAA